MLELNFKVSARKMAVIVIILLAGWGIISFAEVLTSLYRQSKSDSSKKNIKISFARGYCHHGYLAESPR